MSRRYGSKATLYKLSSTDTDYETGQVTKTVEAKSLRRVVQIPVTGSREVTYTAAMMQSLRQFAWQGAPGQNVRETMFLIPFDDLRGWDSIGAEQWIKYGDARYEVVEAQQTPGGWIVQAKQVKGTDASFVFTVTDDSEIEDEGANSVV